MNLDSVTTMLGVFWLVCASAGVCAGQSDMIRVPGGKTDIGSERGLPDERPVHEANVAAYLLDRTPVTVAAFGAFVEATGFVTDAERFGSAAVLDEAAGRWLLQEQASWHHPLGPQGPSAPPDHPVTQVSWQDADAYCNGRGARLPTEIEWEHAARYGHAGDPAYAMGDHVLREGAFLANFWQGRFPHQNTVDDGFRYTSPAGLLGRSPLGLADMAGNVWEWTSSWYVPYDPGAAAAFAPTERVQRGGSFLCSPKGCHGFRVSARGHSTPESSLMHVGFRCAADLPATQGAMPGAAMATAPAIPPEPVARLVSKPVPREAQRKALFGDLHVHTSYSFDAFMSGNRVGPRDAYRFARGERIRLPTGVEEQLSQPLDFAAITDHAENLEVVAICSDPDDARYRREACERVRNPGSPGQYFRERFAGGVKRPAEPYPGVCDSETECREAALGPWQDIQAAAEEFNDPGTFTTLIAYEFSPVLPSFGMLHRNVIFRGTDVTRRAISSMDVRDTADFFAQLDQACRGDCEVVTIPHNSNFSWGLTFSRQDEDGSAYTGEDLERRMRFDRLAEIFQQKGASECAVGVGTTDEACAFEQIFPACEDGERGRCAEAGSFVRSALQDGLAFEAARGVNPFKLGIIGSTDTHNTDPGNTAESRRGAHAQGSARAAGAMLEASHPVIGPIRTTNPGGLAGVWAEANTRDAIFDALKRRETFATSGTRLRVRFFGGFELPNDLGERQDGIAAAYAGGVPMGGDLRGRKGAGAPTFWVWAARGPDGATLDRIEIVQGSYDGQRSRERVWDVACSGGRVPDPESGRCPATAATVDPETCARSDESGAAELKALFSPPDFTSGDRSFFYAKVYENPSCRWTTVLARSAGLEPPVDQPVSIQERAWSSPIWYSPAMD